MPRNRRSLIDLRETRWFCALVGALVIASLMMQSVGVSLLRTAATRTESEEPSEESKSEVELRELSHRCARVRICGPLLASVRPNRLLPDESQPCAPALPEQWVAAYLVGAGVCLRC